MALIRKGQLSDDEFQFLGDETELPVEGSIIVTLARWHSNRDQLCARADPVGIQLRSDEPPEMIGEGLEQLAVIALDFPVFRDGRAYSYARLLRDKYGYSGEIRAIGNVMLEQLHFMVRTGFDAFEIQSDDPVSDFSIASEDFSVWYQPTGDGRRAAFELRKQA